MLDLNEARRRILSVIEPLPIESVSLSASAGRITAIEVTSPINLPSFDNSAMDGYAIHAADVSSARAEIPVALDLAGRVSAGEALARPLERGACVRLFTGSALPAQAAPAVTPGE